MSIQLTRRESTLLHLLAVASEPQSIRQLAGELIMRGYRGISDRAVKDSLHELTARSLARLAPGRADGYEITGRGWHRPGEPPRAIPPAGPEPEPEPEPLPDRVQAGQIWEGSRGVTEGRRIRVGQVDAGAGMVYYRITRHRPGVRVRRTGGRCRIYSLLAAYRLVSTPAAGEPAEITHLMITDPSEPGYDDVFSRCCGVNWRSLAMSGLITSVRELVNCPGRPADALPDEEA